MTRIHIAPLARPVEESLTAAQARNVEGAGPAFYGSFGSPYGYYAPYPAIAPYPGVTVLSPWGFGYYTAPYVAPPVYYSPLVVRRGFGFSIRW